MNTKAKQICPPNALLMHEWGDEINRLSQEDAGAIMMALMEYNATGVDNFEERLFIEREKIADLLLEGTLTMDEWLKRNDEISVLMTIWRRYKQVADKAITTYNNKCKKRGPYKKTREAQAEQSSEEQTSIPDEIDETSDEEEAPAAIQAKPTKEEQPAVKPNPFASYLANERDRAQDIINDILDKDDDDIIYDDDDEYTDGEELSPFGDYFR